MKRLSISLVLLALLAFITLGSVIAQTSGTSLNASSGAAAGGSSVTLTWSGIQTPNSMDWIGLYPQGATDAKSNLVDWVYLTGRQDPTPSIPVATSSLSFPIPRAEAAGSYEFRLFNGDSSNFRLASVPITITEDRSKWVGLRVSPTQTPQDSLVSLTWNYFLNQTSSRMDAIIKMYAPSARDLDWQPGTVYYPGIHQSEDPGGYFYHIPADLPSGTYEFRIFSLCSGVSECLSRQGVSNPITVGTLIPTPTPTSTAVPTVVPPTSTSTAVPTAIPPTATPVPTSVPPTATPVPTNVPPTATSGPAAPSGEGGGSEEPQWRPWPTPTPDLNTGWGYTAPASGGAMDSLDGRIRVDMPGGASDRDLKLWYQRLCGSEIGPADGWSFVGCPFELRAVETWDERVRVTQFSRPLDVTFRYTDAEARGLVESSFRLAFYDGISWVPFPSTVDDAANILYSRTDHFSLFSVLGSSRPQGSTISGRVFYDRNGNGVFDGDDFPIWRAGIRASSGSWSGFTTSSPDGGYSFSGLEAGSYAVELVVGPEWAFTTPPRSEGIAVSGQTGSIGSAPGFGMWYRLP